MYWSIPYWNILPRIENLKIHRYSLKFKYLKRSSITPFEVFYKDLIDVNYENASFLLREGSKQLQLIFFLTTIILWFVIKCLFPGRQGHYQLTASQSVQAFDCLISQCCCDRSLSDPSWKVWFSKIRLESKITE